VFGLLRHRVVLTVTVCLWVIAVCAALSGAPFEENPTWLWMPQRGFLMFGLGALIWLNRNRLVLDWRLAALAAASIPLGALMFENYRILAAPGLAYLVIWAGLKGGRWPALVFRHDLSYGAYIYGFPLQQALLVAGFTTSWAPFFIASLVLVLPVAALSWLLVERPAQQWGRRRPPVALEASASAVAAAPSN
jgi:peptidoglycan/LPS O-acetylase OafA/YrhL